MRSVVPQAHYPLRDIELLRDLEQGRLLRVPYVRYMIQKPHYGGRVHQAQIVLVADRQLPVTDLRSPFAVPEADLHDR